MKVAWCMDQLESKYQFFCHWQHASSLFAQKEHSPRAWSFGKASERNDHNIIYAYLNLLR
jgi:hypothetical protein